MNWTGGAFRDREISMLFEKAVLGEDQVMRFNLEPE
jgi:hypothetical protein